MSTVLAAGVCPCDLLAHCFVVRFIRIRGGPRPSCSLWGEAGAPGGTVRRAAVCGNGAPAPLVSVSTDFPNEYG